MRNIVYYRNINQALERVIHDRKVLSIFLDFKRGFETIDRDILLTILSRYGIKDKELM